MWCCGWNLKAPIDIAKYRFRTIVFHWPQVIYISHTIDYLWRFSACKVKSESKVLPLNGAAEQTGVYFQCSMETICIYRRSLYKLTFCGPQPVWRKKFRPGPRCKILCGTRSNYIWNKLPVKLRLSGLSADSFTNRLKTYLMENILWLILLAHLCRLVNLRYINVLFDWLIDWLIDWLKVRCIFMLIRHFD